MYGRTDHTSCEADEEPCDVCQRQIVEAGSEAEEDEEECRLPQRETTVEKMRDEPCCTLPSFGSSWRDSV